MDRKKYQKEWHKEYRIKNRDKLNAYQRKRYATIPEVREKLIEYSRNWRIKNNARAKDTYKRYNKNNQEKRRKYYEEFRRKYPDKIIYQGRMRHYGITKIQFDEILSKQNGVCAICKGSVVGKRKCHIDHDHSNNKVRGILCQDCNLGIGRLKENIDIFNFAINYLIKWKSIHASQSLCIDKNDSSNIEIGDSLKLLA